MSPGKWALLPATAACTPLAGIDHFRDPGLYLPMMPPDLPGTAS